MSTHKKIDGICITVLIFTIALTVLLMNRKGFAVIPVTSEEAGGNMFTANDLDADWDVSSATHITLSDKKSTISGNGAYVNDGNIYIVYAGHYVLTGELTNGSVIIDADKSDKIWLSLAGVTLHCDDDAAIRVEQADKVFLTLADGAENTISSGGQYNAETIASGVDGVIYSRDDLTINGNGALAVNAEYCHGIVCNDDLVITGGNITINAVQDGIHANDSVRIRNAGILILAGDDGITVSNDDETAFLYVESGSITIPACYEGLEAVDITIAGGTIDITPKDDGINAGGSGDDSVIRIAGGDITIINPAGRDADGLDSNGSIYIAGGKVFISVTDSGGNCALDCGSENGGECIVNGGTVIACGGLAMAEGFDAASTQGFLMYNTTAAAGTTVSLEDAFGEELLSEEIPCSFSSVVLSTPELKVGDSCMITVGSIQEQITIDNASNAGFVPVGMFGGGMMNGRNHGGMERPDRMGMPDGEKQLDEEKQPGDEPWQDEERQPGEEWQPNDESWQDGERQPGEERQPVGEWKSDDERMQDGAKRPDRQGMWENGERTSAPDEEPAGKSGSLFLLGISVLALSIGLLIVIKTKY